MLTDDQTGQLLSDLVASVSHGLPPEIRISAVAGHVRLEAGESWALLDFSSIVRQPGTSSVHVERATHAVLSGIQDFAVAELRRKWPEPRVRSAELPMPQVSIHWPRIDFGFGDDSNPVLRFDPVEVKELRDRPST